VGLRPSGDALRLDPRLPAEWGALEIGVVFRGARIQVRVENPTVTVWSDRRVPILFRERTRHVTATPEGIKLHPGRRRAS
jgi:cellobiose phosphorylase